MNLTWNLSCDPTGLLLLRDPLNPLHAGSFESERPSPDREWRYRFDHAKNPRHGVGGRPDRRMGRLRRRACRYRGGLMSGSAPPMFHIPGLGASVAGQPGCNRAVRAAHLISEGLFAGRALVLPYSSSEGQSSWSFVLASAIVNCQSTLALAVSRRFSHACVCRRSSDSG